MGVRARKSFKAGPARVTFSKSGVSTSVGVKGVRVGKMANGKTRTTLSVPGTGISYVSESGKSGEDDFEIEDRPNNKTSPVGTCIFGILVFVCGALFLIISMIYPLCLIVAIPFLVGGFKLIRHPQKYSAKWNKFFGYEEDSQ